MRAPVVVLVVIVALLLVPGLFWMGPWMWGPGMMGGWYGRGFGMMGGWGGAWPWILGVALLAPVGAAIWLGYLAVTRLSWPAATRRALQILQVRYARGEITKDEYEEMRRAIA